MLTCPTITTDCRNFMPGQLATHPQIYEALTPHSYSGVTPCKRLLNGLLSSMAALMKAD